MIKIRHIFSLTAGLAILLSGALQVSAQNSESKHEETLSTLLEELRATHSAAINSDSLLVDSRIYRDQM